MEMEKQSSFDKIKIGDNINGEIIKKKYFYDKLHNFFIYKNDRDEIGFFSNMPVTNISSLLSKCSLVKELSHGKKFKEWIDAQKAVALNEFFIGNEDKSREVLELCIEAAINKEKSRKKMFYIGMYMGMVLLLIIIALIFDFIGVEWKYLEYLYIIIFGAFGGFISLNSRLEKIEFSIDERTWSYILVSVFKMAFACISSIIVYFLIKSDIILSAVKGSQGIIYIAAALAGFSESLLPNIFSGVEKDILVRDK